MFLKVTSVILNRPHVRFDQLLIALQNGVFSGTVFRHAHFDLWKYIIIIFTQVSHRASGLAITQSVFRRPRLQQIDPRVHNANAPTSLYMQKNPECGFPAIVVKSSRFALDDSHTVCMTTGLYVDQRDLAYIGITKSRNRSLTASRLFTRPWSHYANGAEIFIRFSITTIRSELN